MELGNPRNGAEGNSVPPESLAREATQSRRARASASAPALGLAAPRSAARAGPDRRPRPLALAGAERSGPVGPERGCAPRATRPTPRLECISARLRAAASNGPRWRRRSRARAPSHGVWRWGEGAERPFGRRGEAGARGERAERARGGGLGAVAERSARRSGRRSGDERAQSGPWGRRASRTRHGTSVRGLDRRGRSGAPGSGARAAGLRIRFEIRARALTQGPRSGSPSGRG